MRHPLADFGRNLVRGFLHLLYPGACLICDAPLPADLDHFCPSCREVLKTDPHRTCPRCAATVGPFAHVENGCAKCQQESFRFDRVLRLGVYDGVVKQAVLKLKHHTGEGLAECLGELWAEQAEAALRSVAADVVIPIPLHWWRRLSRGYNQSDSLGRAIALRLKLPFRPGWLRRIRSTPRQAFLDPADKKANVRDAFRASPRRELLGRTVMLVDDVLTTGSTASEAARALRAVGVARVVVAVLARA